MKVDRDIDKLIEPFQSCVKNFLKDCEKEGIHIFVTEAVRTEERQAELYAQGRTKPGAIVTWTLKSKHIERKAIDIAFKQSVHGSLYPRDMKLWNKVYDIAEAHYIVSLYRNYGVDMPHLEISGDNIYNDSEFTKYLNQKPMDDKQKQLVQSMIYQFKNSHNYGTDEMKKLVEKQVGEWRKLIEE